MLLLEKSAVLLVKIVRGNSLKDLLYHLASKKKTPPPRPQKQTPPPPPLEEDEEEEDDDEELRLPFLPLLRPEHEEEDEEDNKYEGVERLLDLERRRPNGNRDRAGLRA